MARYVVTKGGTVAGGGYLQPARQHQAAQVVELSAAEVTALNAAGITLRAVTTRDALGLGAGASNSD